MIRRTSHRKTVCKHHLHKLGISPCHARAVIPLPSAWGQNLSCLREVHYPLRSVTRQYLCITYETGVARPVVVGRWLERLALVVPLAAILLKRADATVFTAWMKHA